VAIRQIKLIAILVCLGTCSPAIAQFLKVTNIEIAGNKRTKDIIILRELQFKVGDRIQQSQLTAVIDENRYNLLATGLFNQVAFNVSKWDLENNEIELIIIVSENPWIVPVPIFDLADRNFNVWWNEFNASFSRVNYGLRLGLYNAWGYGEKFKIKAQFGYTPLFEFSTLLPFLDNNQTVRLELDATYSTNKEVAMFNRENLKIFHRQPDERIIFKRQNYRVGLIFRPKIFATHIFRVGFANNWIDEQQMLEYNADFFLDGRTRQRFFYAEYDFRYDTRDLPILATEGWLARVQFYKNGFGVFNDLAGTYLEPRFEYYHSLGRRWIASIALSGKVALQREQQPFYNYMGLGYGKNYVRGYELYVADGLDFFLTKLTAQFRVWESSINWNKIMPIKGMRQMPFAIYLAANYDTGYTNDPFYFEGNSFTNRWLHGGGLGLNIMIYNTAVFQIEYSINHLGERGIFLNTNTAF